MMTMGKANIVRICNAKQNPQTKKQLSFGSTIYNKDAEIFQKTREADPLDHQILYKRDLNRELPKKRPQAEKYLEVLRTADKESEEWLEARNNLATVFSPIVLKVAGKLSYRSGFENADLKQEGNIALLQILDAEEIDYKVPVREIGSLIRTSLWRSLPRIIRKEQAITNVTTANKIKNRQDFQRQIMNLWIENQGARPITTDEAAESMNISKYPKAPKRNNGNFIQNFDNSADQLRELAHTRSLNTPIFDDSSSTLGDRLSTTVDNPETAILKKEVNRVVEDQIQESIAASGKKVKAKTQDIIEKTLFKDGEFVEDDATLRSIAKEHNVSDESIRQLRNKIVKKLGTNIAEKLSINPKKIEVGDFRELSLK